LINDSELFDKTWYLEHNPDVASSGADPALHYIRHGAVEGRAASPFFDTRLYLSNNPDVALNGVNPLVHYLRHGEAEGRLISGRVVMPGEGLALPGLFPGSKFDELALHDSAGIARYMTRSATPAESLARVGPNLYSPTISLLIPIYNTAPGFFREVLQSVYAQTYTNWELCIVDDGSSSAKSIAIFDELAQSPDPRIKTLRLEENRGIAAASHAALGLATGEFVGFLDHDDMLTANALSEVIGCLRGNRTIDFIYTDHVMVDHEGHPKHFAQKPAWSPEFLLSTNYIVHFKVVRRSLLLSIGGLANEIDNAQDLGVTCSLVAAKARVHHLAKPVYLWREHRSSVALSTAAKAGIEDRLMHVYDRYLDQVGVAAKPTWPARFGVTRTGVFQLEFSSDLPRTALVLISKGSVEKEATIRERFAPLLGPRVSLHIVRFGVDEPEATGLHIASDAGFLEFVKSINTDVFAFTTTTAQFIGIDWLSRLVRYASLHPEIGAAGGKVLDPWLQIRSGGLLVDVNGEFQTIGGGYFDNERAHWFTGQIASNVDAISSQMMATSRRALVAVGGLRFFEFGDAAGVAYSASLVSKGYRLVYDPYSRHCDTARLAVPAGARARIRELGRRIAPLRRYEGLGT
jgi:glycosyltransferase involved in cell wall biosynthesis